MMHPSPQTVPDARFHASPRRNPGARETGVTRVDHVVVVLDDDLALLRSLERLLKAHGYHVRAHSEPVDFFRAGMPEVPSCLILDNQLGDCMTGVQVHAELHRRGWKLPTVFVTAHWNVRSVVHAMRAGADGFLSKPYDPAELVEAVAQALQRSRDQHQDGLLAAGVRVKAAALTPRELEIVRLVVAGLFNKEIADQLGIALVTVKVHRGRAMHKLGAGNAADLARLAALAGLVA